LDFLGSNHNTPLNALVYDRNRTSFQSICCLVLSLVFLVVLTFLVLFYICHNIFTNDHKSFVLE
jgi:hypothetical protein